MAVWALKCRFWYSRPFLLKCREEKQNEKKRSKFLGKALRGVCALSNTRLYHKVRKDYPLNLPDSPTPQRWWNPWSKSLSANLWWNRGEILKGINSKNTRPHKRVTMKMVGSFSLLKQPSRWSTLGEELRQMERYVLRSDSWWQNSCFRQLQNHIANLGRREEKLQKLNLSPLLDGS